MTIEPFKVIKLLHAEDGNIYSGKFEVDNQLYYAGIESPYSNVDICVRIDTDGTPIEFIRGGWISRTLISYLHEINNSSMKYCFSTVDLNYGNKNNYSP